MKIHGIMIVLILMASPAAYLLLDRDPLLLVTNFEITPRTVKPGEPYKFSFSALPLRKNGCDGDVDDYEVDSAGSIFLFEQNRMLNRKPDGQHRYERTVISHMGLADGPARYGRHIRHWCNFLQKLIWPMTETRETDFVVQR